MKKSTKKNTKKTTKARKSTKAKARKVKVTKAKKTAKVVKVVERVSNASVQKGIAKMKTPALQKKALALLAEGGSHTRTGSDSYSAKHSDNEVSLAEKKLMVEMQKDGLSYRNLEPVFKLLPANGMNAFRCVREAVAEMRAEKVRSTRAANAAAKTAAASVPATVEAPKQEPVAPVAVETPAPIVAPTVVETPTAKVTVTVETAPAAPAPVAEETPAPVAVVSPEPALAE